VLQASNHRYRDCTSGHNCFTCKDRHNTLLHRNSGPTTMPNPSDPPRPVSASNPHTNSSYSEQVFKTLNPSKISALYTVQNVPPTNNPSEHWVPFPALNGRRIRGHHCHKCGKGHCHTSCS